MIVNGNRVGFRVKVRRQLVRVCVHEDDVAVGHQLPRVVVVGVEVPRVAGHVAGGGDVDGRLGEVTLAWAWGASLQSGERDFRLLPN